MLPNQVSIGAWRRYCQIKLTELKPNVASTNIN